MGRVMYMKKGEVHTAPVGLPTVGTSLTNCTPEDIQRVAQVGLASNYWSVGDTIPIVLNGTIDEVSLSGTYYAFIIGFDHNSSREGSNTIHFQFGKTKAGVDIAFASFTMNGSTSEGGWEACYMRNTICPAFLSIMPAEWQNVISACTKYTDNDGVGLNGTSAVTSTSDYIWLLAEYEVFGSGYGYSGDGFANDYEQNKQKQYDYYKAGNSNIKYKHNATTTACSWWLRSPVMEDGKSFCYVQHSGIANGFTADNSFGFAPGFMVS